MLYIYLAFVGIAFQGLQGKKLYPMVSSTAAQSGMKLIQAVSFSTSLQFMCCQVLRRLVPLHQDVCDALILPPGRVSLVTLVLRAVAIISEKGSCYVTVCLYNFVCQTNIDYSNFYISVLLH